jgi:hypothetical protein
MTTREELIAKVQEVARRRGATALSMRPFTREARISNVTIQKLFGTWSKLCEAAGIAAHPRRVTLTDEDIFREMRKTFLDVGVVPALKDFEPAFKYTASVFNRRGWSWTMAKVKFRAWAEKHDPSFPYMDQLPNGSAAPSARSGVCRHAVDPMSGVHAPRGSRLTGDPLGFGAMANAPVNEMGVLALFAMVAERLGYSLELFNPRFPDCEARRRVSGNRWERVLIELEYRSSNFLAHEHDPKGCHMIVCWEADWRPDDIEVLELRSVVAALQARDAERRRQRRESDQTGGRSDDWSDDGHHRSAGEEEKD